MELIVLQKDDNYSEVYFKLHEEVEELKAEIVKYVIENVDTKEKIAAETLDVIQVCIGLLDKLEQEGVNIRKAAEKHNLKLLNRGWKYKKVIHIDID